MKNKIKQFNKLWILLILITFANCEKEPSIETLHQSKFRLQTITQKELVNDQAIISRLNKLGLFKEENSSSTLSRNIHDNNFSFTINTDSIKHIENLETGIHSYNFPILRDTLVTLNLENLLLQSNEQGDYDVYIVEYGFTNEQLSILNGEFLNNTITKYTPIDFDVSVFNSNELAREVTAELVCTQVWTLEVVPNNQGDLVDGSNLWTEEWILQSEDCNWVYGGGGSGDNGGTTDGGSDGSGTSGGVGSSSGSDVTSTPAGITNDEDPCNPGPEGDINGDCQLSPYEVCLLNGGTEETCNCQELIVLVQNTKIKTEISRLLSMVDTSIDEDGKQFDKIPNSDPIDYNIVNPLQGQTNYIQFPDIRSNTSVNIHLHPKWGFISGESQLRELSPIFSQEDIAYTLQLFDESDEEDDITSILVSSQGVFALRVTDAERAEFMNNKLDQRRHYKKFLTRFNENVLTPEEGQLPYTDEQLVENFVTFLTTYKINDNDGEQGFGMSIYQATLDSNGNITGWTQLLNN